MFSDSSEWSELLHPFHLPEFLYHDECVLVAYIRELGENQTGAKKP
jgi:hypothetical protein